MGPVGHYLTSYLFDAYPQDDGKSKFPTSVYGALPVFSSLPWLSNNGPINESRKFLNGSSIDTFGCDGSLWSSQWVPTTDSFGYATNNLNHSTPSAISTTSQGQPIPCLPWMSMSVPIEGTAQHRNEYRTHLDANSTLTLSSPACMSTKSQVIAATVGATSSIARSLYETGPVPFPSSSPSAPVTTQPDYVHFGSLSTSTSVAGAGLVPATLSPWVPSDGTIGPVSMSTATIIPSINHGSLMATQPAIQTGPAAARRPFRCSTCNKRFTRYSDQQRHTNTVHRNILQAQGLAQNQHFCHVPGCSKARGVGYSRADKLTEHMWKKHANLGYTKAWAIASFSKDRIVVLRFMDEGEELEPDG